MRRGAATIEQTCFRQRERSGAYGKHAGTPRRCSLQLSNNDGGKWRAAMRRHDDEVGICCSGYVLVDLNREILTSRNQAGHGRADPEVELGKADAESGSVLSKYVTEYAELEWREPGKHDDSY
ncbi:hypothetical protein GCM10027402_07710 [Arthrobacter monumenti]